MTRRIFFASVLILCCSNLEATPLQITSGQITFSGGPASGFLGVTFAGENFSGAIGGGAVSVNFATCFPCSPAVNQTIGNGGVLISGSGVNGSFNIDGMSFLATFLTLDSMGVSFGGPAFQLPQAPPFEGEFTLYSTFTFTGSFTHVNPGFTTTVYDFVGSGTAAHTLLDTGQQIQGMPVWITQSVLYEFLDPVPEPTSLLLLGTGLAGILKRRRNMKRPCQP